MLVPALTRNAALLRYGLLHGYVRVAEVVAWADAQIAAQANPHPALLEVAIGGRRTPADLATELAPLAEGCGEEQLIDAKLDLMHRALSRDRGLARRIASELYSLAMAGVTPSGGDSEGWMLYFDDALDLAREGMGPGQETVVQEILRFLAPYAASPRRPA